MQILCGLQVVFFLFNCQTPAEELWFDIEYQKLDRILEKDFQNYFYVGSLLILDESEKI